VIRQYGPLTSDPQTASSTATYFITGNPQNQKEPVHKCHLTLINIINVKKEQWKRERGQWVASIPGGTVQGRHLEGQRYGTMKFGRFWRIGVCIGSCN